MASLTLAPWSAVRLMLASLGHSSLALWAHRGVSFSPTEKWASNRPYFTRIEYGG